MLTANKSLILSKYIGSAEQLIVLSKTNCDLNKINLSWKYMESDNNLNFEITPQEKYGYATKQRVDASWIRLIYIALKQQGLPADNLLESVGIEIGSLHELNFIYRDVVLNLYDNIEISKGLDALPASISQVFQLHFLRYTGVIISDAKSVSDLLEKIIFASTQITELIKVVTTEIDDHTLLAISSRMESFSLHKTTLEIGVCLVYKMINQMFPSCSDIVSNVVIDIKSKRNDFENIFDCPVAYNDKAEYTIIINNNALSMKNVFSTHSIGLEPFIGSNFSNTEFRIFSDIERFIVENIASNNLSIVFIAEKMNVSVKTLQRQLKRCNTDFSTLLKTNKIKHAEMLLKENKLTLTQITYKLGFNSPSSFSRAFKKWTGISPSDYQ
jgi:AraC-like DNA-binding protein